MRYYEKEDDISKYGNSAYRLARPSFSLSYIINLSGSSDISHQLNETPPLPFRSQHPQQTRAR
eukprot:scaffold524951_cov15-Prasinocladus_malaysianus.AAC.1